MLLPYGFLMSRMVRICRCHAGLYQRELAEKLNISQSALSRVETSGRMNLGLLLNLASALDLDPASLASLIDNCPDMLAKHDIEVVSTPTGNDIVASGPFLDKLIADWVINNARHWRDPRKPPREIT